jgi:hypothetical protein
MRKKTAAIFNISGMTKLRITNAYIHDCRIANSAGRKNLAAIVFLSFTPTILNRIFAVHTYSNCI